MGLVNHSYPSQEPLEREATIKQLNLFCRVENVIIKEFKVINFLPIYGLNVEKHWLFDEELISIL